MKNKWYNTGYVGSPIEIRFLYPYKYLYLFVQACRWPYPFVWEWRTSQLCNQCRIEVVLSVRNIIHLIHELSAYTDTGSLDRLEPENEMCLEDSFTFIYIFLINLLPRYHGY